MMLIFFAFIFIGTIIFQLKISNEFKKDRLNSQRKQELLRELADLPMDDKRSKEIVEELQKIDIYNKK